MPIGFHPGRGCDVYSLGPRPTFAPFGGAEIKLISIRLVSFRPSERCRDFIVSHSYKHLTPTGVRIAGTSNEFSLSLYHICHRIHQDVDHCFAVPLSLSRYRSTFCFGPFFSEIQLGIRLALLVLDTRMEGTVEGCGGNPNTRQ
jgi:hypothetical protein